MQFGDNGLEVHLLLSANGFHYFHGSLSGAAAGPLLLVSKYHVLHAFLAGWVALAPIHQHGGLTLQLQRHVLNDVAQRLAIVQLLKTQRRVLGGLLATHTTRLHLPNMRKQLHQPPGKARNNIRPFPGKFL